MIKWFLILTLSTFITISFSNEIDHNPYLVTIDEIQFVTSTVLKS